MWFVHGLSALSADIKRTRKQERKQTTNKQKIKQVPEQSWTPNNDGGHPWKTQETCWQDATTGPWEFQKKNDNAHLPNNSLTGDAIPPQGSSEQLSIQEI
jgi:hypothetical protein